MSRNLLVVALAGSLLAACGSSKKSSSSSGGGSTPLPFSVSGIVTDLGTATALAPDGDPLAGVTVTLISADHLPPATTDAQGAFVFADVAHHDGLVLLFEKSGYAPETKNLGDLVAAAPTPPDSLSWTQPLRRRGDAATVVGRIVAGGGSAPIPIAGATVTLDASPAPAPATTDAYGAFVFSGVTQLSGIRVRASAAAFAAGASAPFSVDASATGRLADGSLATPYHDAGDLALLPATALTGTVSDGSTGLPLSGARVTLVSPDHLPAATTGGDGVYQFPISSSAVPAASSPWSLVVTLGGYATAVLPVPSTDACPAALLTSGILRPTCVLNAALARALGALGGTVRFAGAPAPGALVRLCAANSGCAGADLLGEQAAGVDGSFSFADLRTELSYELDVPPWDANGDGTTDTTPFAATFGPLDAPPGGADLTRLALHLSGPAKTVVASSLVGPAYPVVPTTGGAIAGRVASATAPLTVQFGAPVDTGYTTFLLRAADAFGNPGAPLAATVSWSQGVTATVQPAAPLAPQAGGSIQLLVTALRWTDGVVTIAPAGGSPATASTFALAFQVDVPTAPLPNPTPTVYLGNGARYSGPRLRVPTSAAFDASTVRLLEPNGDVVTAWTSSTGLDLQWPHVAGAAAYRVYMRTSDSSAGGPSGWVQSSVGVSVPSGVSPGTAIVAAGVNPWTQLPAAAPGAPWANGAVVDFAVVSVDAGAVAASIEPAKALHTADTFASGVSAVITDPAGLPAPFTAVAEAGSLFTKSLGVTFAEPLTSSSTPALSLASGALSLVSTPAIGFGTASAPSASAPATASTAWFLVQLRAKGLPCTELTAGVVSGDTLLPVRDETRFAAGTRIALLSTAGTAFTEADAASTAPGLVTLSAPLATIPAGGGLAVPKGALACALSGHGAARAAGSYSTYFVGGVVPAGIDVRVIPLATPADASAYSIGQRVIVYEPFTALGAVSDLRTVIGVDPAAGAIVVTPQVTVGNSDVPGAIVAHTAATVVIPFPAGETALRAAFNVSTAIGLAADVPAGGPATSIRVFPPTTSGYGPAGLPIVAGDGLLLDADGDLTTTGDQVRTTVSQVRCTPALFSGAAPYCAIVADLPAATVLVQGQSTVLGLGDSFRVTGTRDTSGNGPIDPRFDEVSVPATVY